MNEIFRLSKKNSFKMINSNLTYPVRINVFNVEYFEMYPEIYLSVNHNLREVMGQQEMAKRLGMCVAFACGLKPFETRRRRDLEMDQNTISSKIGFSDKLHIKLELTQCISKTS